MADSKISQLPLSPYVLDKDLVVVVTGHLEQGTYPQNAKVPLSYIRRYIVRLNLLTSPQSGIGTYYNSGLNILTLQHIPRTGNLMRYDYADEHPHHQTISTTGLNSIPGNLVDISFASDSDAVLTMNSRSGNWPNSYVNSNFINQFGDPYHSGIISITGLNAYDHNLMRIDFDGAWPYSGGISQTGLNSIRGNMVDIQFASNSDAAAWMNNRDGSWHDGFTTSNLGEKYHSGIISVTGLNAYSGAPYGNLMRVDYDVDQWPYSGVLSTTGLNSIVGNNIDIVFTKTSDASIWMSGRDGSWHRNFDGDIHLGNKYHSGIISTTGLNAYSGAPYGNLIRVDFDVDQWPYSGVISQTGLNSIKGNLVDVQFEATSEAALWMHNRDGSWQDFNRFSHLGNKYHSGIISVTGLNAYSGAPYGNLMRVDYDVDQWPYSGVLSTTGLNSIVGNNMDIVFQNDSDAAIWMSGRNGAWLRNFDGDIHLGNKYHSGIISTTGLNVYSGAPYGNLMRVDFDVDQWPFSGVLSTTGLNAIVGNNLDITFQANSAAANWMHNRDGAWQDFDKFNNLGNKYHSGIISVTGLNAYSGAPYGNLIRVDFDVNQWPYSGVISQTGLNAIRGNLVDIQFEADSDASTSMHSRNGPWYNGFNSGTHVGRKYHSGIISFTGVNAVTENLIVKEYQESWPYTGIYYNTGLNARAGNHIEIMHATNSDANFFYPGIMGGRYQSGVISVTGLNVSQSTGNLITNHIDPNWPHRNILHTTGLNVSNTNLAISDTNVSLIVADIENVFPYKYKLHTTGLNIYNNRNQGTYNQNSLITYDIRPSFPHEYVLHTTGLNLEAGNRIGYDIDSSWPHQYTLYTTGLNIVTGGSSFGFLNGISFNVDSGKYNQYDIFSLDKSRISQTTPVFTNDNSGIGASRTSVSFLDEDILISYVNAGTHQNEDFIVGLRMRVPENSLTVNVPPVADSGSSNALKIYELGSVTGTPVTIAGLTDSVNTDTDSWDPISLGINDNLNPLELKIEVSGYNNVANNVPNPVFTFSYSITDVSPTNPSTVSFNIDSNNDISIDTVARTYINSKYFNLRACVAPKYTLTNPMYVRRYSKYLGVATEDADDYTIGQDVYRYHDAILPAAASFAPTGLRYLKSEHVSNSPVISILQHPQDVYTAAGWFTLTGLASVSDFSAIGYEWQKAPSGTTDFVAVSPIGPYPELTVANWTIDDDESLYRFVAIAYDGTRQASNPATLYIQSPTLSFTQQPSDQPIASDGTATFSVSTTSTPAGASISYEWQISTNNGSSYGNIIPLETNSYLNLSSLSCPTDDGNLYRVKISAEGYTSRFSSSAELHCISISINNQPDNLTVNRGTGLFEVFASQTAGSPFDLYYVWERSTNDGASYFTVQSSTSNRLILSNLTYSNNDQDLYRVKVRLQGFGDDVEAISDAARLTVQEINITSQPTANQIYGKDLEEPTVVQNLVATTGGDLNLNIVAVARNSSATLQYQWQTGNTPTYYWQNPSEWGDIAGEVSSTLEIRGLAENDGYKFYRCLVDDQSLSTSDIGMIRRTSNTVRLSTSTFIVDSAVTIDDNGSFATIERDGTSAVSETDFVTFCYDLINGVGYSVSVDAQANQRAGINLGTGLAPLGPTGIARLEAIHPDSDAATASLGVGTQFNAGDLVNIQVTGNVNQYLARINVPLP